MSSLCDQRNSTVESHGTVSGVTGSSFTLTSGGVAYQATLADNVGYENGMASQLTSGARIEVEATQSTTGLTAYAIEFKNLDYPSDEQVFETGGIAYDVTATRFKVNDLTLEINGVDATGLVNGVEVEVHFIASGDSYLTLGRRISLSRVSP